MERGKRSVISFFAFIMIWIYFLAIGASTGLGGKKNGHVEAANNALKKTIEHGKFNSAQIKTMLSAHDFKAVEVVYEDIFRKYRSDVSYEGLLETAYRFFTSSNDIELSDLDLWAAKTSSYIAYAARGSYKTQRGFIVRGGKASGATPRWKIEDMRRLHEEAVKDLEIATSKNPQLMPAYVCLVRIATASPMPFTPKQILEKALENDKRTFYVRAQYIQSLQPQWGGSYEEMSNFARRTMEYAHLNPRLWTFQGEMDADRGFQFWLRNDLVHAAAAYDAALKYGERIAWLEKHAACYEHLEQKDKAIEDYKRILYYDPENNHALASLKLLQMRR